MLQWFQVFTHTQNTDKTPTMKNYKLHRKSHIDIQTLFPKGLEGEKYTGISTNTNQHIVSEVFQVLVPT
ncbi:hypothetical protein CDL12_28140 [Handroanthus impetiginosus]|uniref:Uncharacterized protein n=1 Tax=Handroanthus impetiginosus TaxID=429701 RepID=A0A2G9G218_9LAMI|nr:hypothetical protein CDL12_28140 [Handroanthus impetiginosus]